LFYLSAEGKLMAVAVTAGASFEAGLRLFCFRLTGGNRFPRRTSSPTMSVRRAEIPDCHESGEANSAPLTVLLNWTSAMEK